MEAPPNDCHIGHSYLYSGRKLFVFFYLQADSPPYLASVMDNLSEADRRRNMAAIRGQDTTPEKAVRRYLHSEGLRYSLHKASLAGSPDVYFRRWGVALFVNGCFWHRHKGCKFATPPKTNRDFWTDKFRRNVERDRRTRRQLQDQGLRVLVIWECEIFMSKSGPLNTDRLRKLVLEIQSRDAET